MSPTSLYLVVNVVHWQDPSVLQHTQEGFNVTFT